MYTYFTNLQHYLENSIEQCPHKTAIIYNKRHYSYVEINNLCNAFANYLIKIGIKRGDRVVVCSANHLETVISFWGALKAGAVISLINPTTPTEKIKYILEDSGARILITEEKSVRGMIPYLLNHFILRQIITIGSELSTNKSSKIIDFNECLKNNYDTPLVTILDIDLASIIYTSGSTGEPKGVMMTHRNMLAASTSINRYLSHISDDIILSALPMSFDYGLYQMIMAFSVGATLAIEHNFTWPAQLLKRIEQLQATVLPLVPTMASLLFEHAERFNFNTASVRCVTNTGAALTPKHIGMIKKIFPQADIFSMYGLTECKRCTYLPPRDIPRKPTSVGLAIPNTEMWIVDEQGQRLSPNQVGQLVIRGATVMKGYWNKPDETAKKLKDGVLPGEKILYTGDYCLMDEEGYLYFQGRMDEVLKCRGMKVSPKEVEDVLMSIDGVKEAAVIGVADDAAGDAIHAFVAISKSLTEQQIMEECRSKLETVKRPNYLTILKEIPKTSNGKLNKLQLKSLICAKPATVNA